MYINTPSISEIFNYVDKYIDLGIYHNLGYLAACIGHYRLNVKYGGGQHEALQPLNTQLQISNIDSECSNLEYDGIEVLEDNILLKYQSLLIKNNIDISLEKLKEVAKEIIFTSDVLCIQKDGDDFGESIRGVATWSKEYFFIVDDTFTYMCMDKKYRKFFCDEVIEEKDVELASDVFIDTNCYESFNIIEKDGKEYIIYIEYEKDIYKHLKTVCKKWLSNYL